MRQVWESKPYVGQGVEPPVEASIESDGLSITGQGKLQGTRDICLRCIRKDPAERIQTAAELVRELQDDWRDSSRR